MRSDFLRESDVFAPMGLAAAPLMAFGSGAQVELVSRKWRQVVVVAQLSPVGARRLRGLRRRIMLNLVEKGKQRIGYTDDVAAGGLVIRTAAALPP